MEYKISKLDGVNIKPYFEKMFNEDFEEALNGEIQENKEAWKNTDLVNGTICKDIMKTAYDDQCVAIPIECWDIDKLQFVDGGFIHVYGWMTKEGGNY